MFKALRFFICIASIHSIYGMEKLFNGTGSCIFLDANKNTQPIMPYHRDTKGKKRAEEPTITYQWLEEDQDLLSLVQGALARSDYDLLRDLQPQLKPGSTLKRIVDFNLSQKNVPQQEQPLASKNVPQQEQPQATPIPIKVKPNIKQPLIKTVPKINIKEPVLPTSKIKSSGTF